MKLSRITGVCALASMLAAPLGAQEHYDFNVLYFGGGVASLAGGSDNPDGTTLVAGDSFFWSIAAQDNAYWNVFEGGSFFPLMAFATDPSGTRTGQYTLELFRNGASVFTLSEESAQSYFHIGTNSVSLVTGFQFDVMTLSYELLDAFADDPPAAADGALPFGGHDEFESTLFGTLPIFGAPELNRFYPGIEYVTASAVPEPSSALLLGAGLFAASVLARRRSKQNA